MDSFVASKYGSRIFTPFNIRVMLINYKAPPCSNAVLLANVIKEFPLVVIIELL